MKRLNIKLPTLPLLALCYTYAGLFLWLMEWVRPLFSIPVICLLGVGLYWFMKEAPIKKEVHVSRNILVFCAVLLFLYTVFCGSGGFFLQPGDWIKHNAVLHDLISKGWPVYYHNDSSEAMLTYYIGQYLVPAAAGKLFHSFRAGELAMLVWNFLGIYLTVLLLFQVTKANTWRKQIFAVFTFLFFSTLLFLSRFLYASTAMYINDVMMDRYWLSTVLILFRSTLNLFRWIPTNGPPAWIAAALFAEQQESPKYYLLFAAPLMIHASFPFLGLALLMLGIFIVKMARPDTRKEERQNWLKNCVSVPNLCALTGLIIEIAYFIGNVGGEKPEGISFSFIDYGGNPALYFCFCAGFVCYSIVIFQTFKDTPLFYVVNALLFLFPFFKLGLFNDLCMNASIPAVFLLMTFVIRGMFRYTSRESLCHGRAAVLTLLLVLGSIYPVQEMYESVITIGPAWDGSQRIDWAGTLNIYVRDGETETTFPDMAYNYYTYDYEQSLFYIWFAKDK